MGGTRSVNGLLFEPSFLDDPVHNIKTMIRGGRHYRRRTKCFHRTDENEHLVGLGERVSDALMPISILMMSTTSRSPDDFRLPRGTKRPSTNQTRQLSGRIRTYKKKAPFHAALNSN